MNNNSIDKLSSGEFNASAWQLSLNFAKLVAKIVGIIVLVAVLIYGAIVTTVARYVYIYDHGYVLTQNVKTDMLPYGETVLFDTNPIGTSSKVDSFFGKIELATFPPLSTSVGVIEAGPQGRMTLDDNLRVKVKKNITGLKLKEKPAWNSQYLTHQYIIKCVKGGCKPGKSYLLPAFAVNGVLSGTKDIDNAKSKFKDYHAHDVKLFKDSLTEDEKAAKSFDSPTFKPVEAE